MHRFGVRCKFVKNLCTLRQLFVVFAVFVQQTKGFVIATAGIAELFLCPIQVAKAQKQYSFLYSATCRFLVALLIGRNGVCCIFVGKIDIAHCIIYLVEILLVLVGSNHTFQAAYHLFGLSCCHYFGCCNACIKLQLVGWIGTNDVLKSVVSCVFVAKSSLNLSHKIPFACFLLASHLLFNYSAQVGNGFFEFARVYVIVGKGVIPFANSTPIYWIALHIADYIFCIVKPTCLYVRLCEPRTRLAINGWLCSVEPAHIRKSSGSLFKSSFMKLRTSH